MGKVRGLFFVGMLVSTPAIGAETYACFKKGIDNPEPKKFVMSADGAEFFDTIYKLKKSQVHSEPNSLSRLKKQINLSRRFLSTTVWITSLATSLSSDRCHNQKYQECEPEKVPTPIISH